MIHYTCDFCHCRLDESDGSRFVVKIEVYPAFDSFGDLDVEDDRDYLLEIHENLEQVPLPVTDEEVLQEMRFDLCSECRTKFAKNPLGRQLSSSFSFSKN